MASIKSKEDKYTRMSEFIQTELDRKYSPGWQCIVGNKLRVTPKVIPGDPKGVPDTFIVRGHLSFGIRVNHKVGHFVHMSVRRGVVTTHFVIFKGNRNSKWTRRNLLVKCIMMLCSVALNTRLLKI